MKKIAFISSIIAVIYFMNTGCSKPETPITPYVADSGKIYLHLHTNLDTNEAEEGNTYTMSDGRKVLLGAAKMYIANMQLVTPENRTVNIPVSVILKTVDQEVYYVGKVPAGTYKSITFFAGIDASTDKKTPGATDTALNRSDMWFGSSASDGHVFIDFEGAIDTTANATGTTAQMQPFMYRIGTNNNYKWVAMPDHSPVYTVGKDSSQYVHIIVDYYKLLKNVQLNKPANLMVHTAADNSPTGVSGTIGNNVPNIFSYEE